MVVSTGKNRRMNVVTFMVWVSVCILLSLGVAPRVLVPKTNGLDCDPLKVKSLRGLTSGLGISNSLCSKHSLVDKKSLTSIFRSTT